MGGRSFSEPGTGSHALATKPKVHSVVPRLEWTQTIRKLSSLIAPTSSPFYVFANAEAALTSADIIFTDGKKDVELTSGFFDSCEVSIKYGQSIRAAIAYVCKLYDNTATYGTHQKDTEEPMDWTALTTLKLATTPITNWRAVTFRVANNIQVEHLGSDILPSEVFQKHFLYSGTIQRALTGASEAVTIMQGSKKDVEIQLTDNAASPVTTTIKFNTAALFTSREEVPELGLTLETINWEAGSLTLSS